MERKITYCLVVPSRREFAYQILNIHGSGTIQESVLPFVSFSIYNKFAFVYNKFT